MSADPTGAVATRPCADVVWTANRLYAAVGKLDAAQNEPVLGGNAVLAQQRQRGMIRLNVERRGDLPLLSALPHQGRVAAAADGDGLLPGRVAGLLPGDRATGGNGLFLLLLFVIMMSSQKWR